MDGTGDLAQPQRLERQLVAGVLDDPVDDKHRGVAQQDALLVPQVGGDDHLRPHGAVLDDEEGEPLGGAGSLTPHDEAGGQHLRLAWGPT